MNMHHDMTKGPIGRELVLFSLPLMLAHVLQLLYGVADMLVVSRFVGAALILLVVLKLALKQQEAIQLFSLYFS